MHQVELMLEPFEFGGLRRRVSWRAASGGLALAVCACFVASWLGSWSLPFAAALAAAYSFPILQGWRRSSPAIAVLCLAAGVGDSLILILAAVAAALVRALDTDAAGWEKVWACCSALLASVAAIGCLQWVDAPPLGAACLFAAVFFFTDAALNLVLVAMREGAAATNQAFDGAVVEGLIWLAAAPLGVVGATDWWSPGAALALLAGELLLGLGLWGAYGRLRAAEQELQAVQGLPAQIVAALADVHSEARVRTATILVRGAARRLRVQVIPTLRAEAAVALLAADRPLAEVRLRGGQAADALRSTLRAAEEQFDGTGPRGWQGREISIEGRLAAAVRCWVSLRRGSAESLTPEQCSDLMRSQSGMALDPDVVDAVQKTVAELPEHLLDVRSPSPEGGMLFGGRHLDALSEDDAALLERAPELLVAYFEILSILAGDLNFEHHLQQSLRIIRQAVECDQAALFLAEDEGFVLRHGLGLPQRLSRIRLPLDCELLAESAVYPDVEQLALSVNESELHLLVGRSRSVMTAALRTEGRQVGSILLLSSRWSAFRPEQSRFVQLCAARLGTVVASSSAIDRIYREAQSDPVTGLPNVRGAMRRLESEIARASRSGQPLTVLFLDIDRLKPVNDQYGHRAGDRLLAEIARRLEGAMRRYDFLARIGGDEFVAIMPGLNPADVDRRMTQLRRAVARKPITVAHRVAVRTSVSIGSAGYPEDGASADDLVAVSDQRMYVDKRSRRTAAAQAASA